MRKRVCFLTLVNVLLVAGPACQGQHAVAYRAAVSDAPSQTQKSHGPRTVRNGTARVNRSVIQVTSATPGADICAKIAAAIAALPSTGGIVDTRGMQGVQPCASNPFAGMKGPANVPVFLQLGCVNIQINTSSAIWQIQAQKIALEGTDRSCTWISYTGTGAVNYVVGFDASSNSVNGGSGLYGNRMSNVFISGNRQSTEALAIINNHNFIAENVNAWNAATHGVYVQGAITPTLSNVHVSAKDTLVFGVNLIQTPVNGMTLDQGTFAPGNIQVTDGVVLNAVMDGVTLGWWLKVAETMTFLGGTSESNVQGAQVDPLSTGNMFIGPDWEANTGGTDLLDNGNSTLVKNAVCVSKNGIVLGPNSKNFNSEGSLLGPPISVDPSAASPGGLWPLPINVYMSATKRWQGAQNSGSVGLNASGAAEVDYLHNVYNAAGNEAHTWFAANSGNTGYNKLGGWLESGNFNLLRGYVSTYNGTATVNKGVPFEVLKADATMQAANIGSTSLGNAPYTGMYLVSCYVAMTQPATRSSTVPAMSITWTDADSGVPVTIQCTGSGGAGFGTSGSFGNQPGTANVGTVTISALSGSPISYTTTGYASSGATAMQYAAHVIVSSY